MYCRNCGKEIDDKAFVCVHCGVLPKVEKKYCQNCGQTTEMNQVVCTKCGVRLANAHREKSKIIAGLFAILLGGFGAHKFYLGYTTEGIITLIVMLGGLMFFGIAAIIMAIIVIIEGIIYLTKSDEEFLKIYVDSKRGWF